MSNLRFGLAMMALVICLAVTVPAQGVEPLFDGELGAPIYSTLGRSPVGVGWVAYGDVYPAGTFDQRPACGPPNVITIGRYMARVEYGTPEFYVATYRVTFFGAEVRQFVFSGIFEYQPDELAIPLPMLLSASELVKAVLVGELEAEFTPHSTACFGGRVRILPAGAGNLFKGERK